MNSGAVAERVYGAVKRRIMSGVIRHGERIDMATLAQELDSSATPVRDALHLLVGERLIETRAGDGFQVPQLDAPALNDLYQWNMDVLLQLLRGGSDMVPRHGTRGNRPRRNWSARSLRGSHQGPSTRSAISRMSACCTSADSLAIAPANARHVDGDRW